VGRTDHPFGERKYIFTSILEASKDGLSTVIKIKRALRMLVCESSSKICPSSTYGDVIPLPVVVGGILHDFHFI
jgi:hypothetical protein